MAATRGWQRISRASSGGCACGWKSGLRIEAKRVPFTVEATEKVLDDVSVGGLKLRLRADRVDRVGDGKRLLLDYKSGEVATKDWEGMRPNEPQLPLYAIFGNVEDVARRGVRADQRGEDRAGRLRERCARAVVCRCDVELEAGEESL